MFDRLLKKRGLKDGPGQDSDLTSVRSPRQNFLLDASAALLLASSVTMVTDFSRRVIGANPDELGIFSVSVGAVFSVAATGSFTKAGWQWIESVLSRHVGSNSPSRLRLILSALFFAIVCPTWLFAPMGLARYDNHWGMYFVESKNPSKALTYLERSITLNPRVSAPHYNLGELFEKSYQYDQAITQYEQAIAISHQDLRSYNNLARLLVINGNAATALRIINEAPVENSQDKAGLSAIYGQKGLAEFDLGFLQAAIGDAELSQKNNPNAAAYCLLGKIYVTLKDPKDARTAWDQFTQIEGAARSEGVPAPPDCKLRAEEFYAKN